MTVARRGLSCSADGFVHSGIRRTAMNPKAYRVTLANGRYADRVLKTLVYGRKPKWLVGGWADEDRLF